MFGVAKEYAEDFADILHTLNERWIDGNDSAASDIHFETHTTYKKTAPKDYTTDNPSGYPKTTKDDPVTGRKIFLFSVNDKTTYIQQAEELADAKVNGSTCGGFLSKVRGTTRFTKWKKVKQEPPMYYVVSYDRDENTGEPLIVTFFLADRDGFQANALKFRVGDLPAAEKKVDFSKYSSPYNKPSGKVYYQEYAEDGTTKVNNEKEFDSWLKAKNCFIKNTCVFKAEKYDVHGNLIPEETLTRENPKKLTVNAHGASLDEGVDIMSESGYDGYSMSNNARAAYANDEKPLSKWSKEDIIYCASRINKYKAMLLKKVSLEDLRNHLLTRTSWHHTSSYYNQTDFYSFDEEAYEDVHESDINRWVEAHKQDVADKKKETPRIRKGRIDYLVWSGSRAHPRASEGHLDNVNIEERGSFYVITDDSGKEILRKKIGSNGTRVRFYESIDALEEARKQMAVKSNGVYSVMRGEWVKEPVADDIPEVDNKAFDAELTQWEDRYFDVSENPTKESIDSFIEDIYDLRKSSIADDGEYSIGNLVFKQLRDFGYLDELKDKKREIVSKELSLESVVK